MDRGRRELFEKTGRRLDHFQLRLAGKQRAYGPLTRAVCLYC